MKRRAFIISLSGAVAASPLGAEAQRPFTPEIWKGTKRAMIHRQMFNQRTHGPVAVIRFRSGLDSNNGPAMGFRYSRPSIRRVGGARL